MCVPNLEFQRVNPSTQVALFAICLGNCTSLRNITWKVYEGSMNTTSNFTKWNLFNQRTSYENIWFFGKTFFFEKENFLKIFLGANTSSFTATNQLFLANIQITLWRFEVVYAFEKATSSSALNFVINQSPYNGSCSIESLNDTTNTLFTVDCPDWFDEDNIKDYSLYCMQIFSFVIGETNLHSIFSLDR